MRTPALIAQALGWPEAHPEPPARLIIRKANPGSHGSWFWMIRRGPRIIECQLERSWPQALTLGLAALERHTLRRAGS